MDVGQMSAAQVEMAIAGLQYGWDHLSKIGHSLGEEELRGLKDALIARESALFARQFVVGKPLRGVSLDVALCGDRDSLRQAIQYTLATLESGQVDSSRLHEALRRSDELGAKWEPREVEAVELARKFEAACWSLSVTHDALRRILETQQGIVSFDPRVQASLDAAREIVGGGK